MDEHTPSEQDTNEIPVQKAETGGAGRDESGRFAPGTSVGAETRIKPGEVRNPDGRASPGARAQRLLKEALRELSQEERMVKQDQGDGTTARKRMQLIEFLAERLFFLAAKGNPAAIREVCNMLGANDDGPTLAEVRLLVPRGGYLDRRFNDDRSEGGDEHKA